MSITFLKNFTFSKTSIASKEQFLHDIKYFKICQECLT